jgi:hypothetical protein
LGDLGKFFSKCPALFSIILCLILNKDFGNNSHDEKQDNRTTATFGNKVILQETRDTTL